MAELESAEEKAKVEWAIGHLKLWPSAYAMGAHDSRVAATVLFEIDRLSAELTTLRKSHQNPESIALIEARDTAIREAAKLDLLKEIRQLVRTNKWCNLVGSKEAAWGRAYADVMAQLELKYATPASGGENG